MNKKEFLVIGKLSHRISKQQTKNPSFGDYFNYPIFELKINQLRFPIQLILWKERGPEPHSNWDRIIV